LASPSETRHSTGAIAGTETHHFVVTPTAEPIEPDPDRLALYDYPLDGVRIADEPAAERDASRLLVHDRASSATRHATFRELPELLHAGDLLVLNDTRVVPARLRARRRTGGGVEVVLHPTGDAGGADTEVVQALLQPSARVKAGERLEIEGGGSLIVIDPPGAELRRVRVAGGADAALASGRLALPPYLPRDPAAHETPLDRERYQTVYAERPGAIAAPTAGLHFTDALFERLRERGVETTRITLHVGPGTFLPVRSERLSEHVMHDELYEIGAPAVAAIAAARARGGRVIAVGTTTTRALESAAAEGGLRPGRARTRLLIRPPFRFRAIDALLTNFHLPRTTLLALVSAFAGRERVLGLYREAAALGYRFYSYGDAMLLR
jgi:S-adenosylmethionine:tRNA ribosyltransferase-isomerase